MNRLALAIAVFAVATVCGCSDPTLEHREKLALCFVKELAPLDIDFDAIPPEMHRMHMGAASAKRSAELMEQFLAEPTPLDAELIGLVKTYAANSRLRGEQFAAAVSANRPELNEQEGEIAGECARQDLFLGKEICERIDFDSLVTVSN
ncbi:hypothetical protein OAG76_01410 [Rubripirellula sp.]|nr:hypothetical protein [Rubripirellula sp.]MDB4634040.1 hypothetical protein [Rubripirellula sp.]